MGGESLWLGKLRGPVRLAMIGSAILAALIYGWLVVNAILF